MKSFNKDNSSQEQVGFPSSENIPISENELQMLRNLKRKSSQIQFQNIGENQDINQEKTIPIFEKIMMGVQNTIAFAEEKESPVQKKLILRGKTSMIETGKAPTGLEGLPDLLIQEKKKAAINLLDMVKLREKYRFQDHSDYKKCNDLIIKKKKQAGSTEPIIDYLQEIPLLPKMENVKIEINEDEVYQGVYLVRIEEKSLLSEKMPSSLEFLNDLTEMVTHIHKSINKSLTNTRLQILDEKYKIYKLYYTEKEAYETQEIVHRDFYNCRKVDTHIHFAACMRAKQLLRFMMDKIESDKDKKVIFDKKENRPLTLKEICVKIGVNSKDINLDSLNVQADSSIFDRFDRFNEKYNPLGATDLREIFLKTDNFIHGQYLADLTKQVMKEMEEEKYCFAELRISIYGKSNQEWSKLADWFKMHKIFSHQIRWLIQIPRLYSVYRKNNIIKNFQEMLDNIFKPIFEVTIDPSIDPALYSLLFQVVGFDTVDDESIYEVLQLKHLDLPPHKWTEEENPIYAYWIYYIYANLFSLNSLRAARGLNTFSFRPHCGESGNIDHLATGFLLADGINHGIRLDHSPVLQYLYYLKQVGIAMSPLSNNKLFLKYQSNPFPKFFSRGLNVSLSTDDPLMIHLTKEPLLEEYAVAAQVWNFSTVDLCEIARNSVQQSSFEDMLKKHWIGEDYASGERDGNEPNLTNVPNSRYYYRFDTLKEEKKFLKELSEIKIN